MRDLSNTIQMSFFAGSVELTTPIHHQLLCFVCVRSSLCIVFVVQGLDEDVREKIEGHRAGTYVRIEFESKLLDSCLRSC